jgi:hypothetical protein
MCILRAIYTMQNAKVLRAAAGLGGEVKMFSGRKRRRTGEYDGAWCGEAVAVVEEGGGSFGLYQKLARCC